MEQTTAAPPPSSNIVASTLGSTRTRLTDDPYDGLQKCDCCNFPSYPYHHARHCTKREYDSRNCEQVPRLKLQLRLLKSDAVGHKTATSVVQPEAAANVACSSSAQAQEPTLLEEEEIMSYSVDRPRVDTVSPIKCQAKKKEAESVSRNSLNICTDFCGVTELARA